MTPIGNEVSELVRLAFAYGSAELRSRALPLFALEARLASIIARMNEPLLAQMRLAWWRDQLMMQATERPAGDLVLAELTRCWDHQVDVPRGLIDGWETWSKADLDRDGWLAFVDGYQDLFAALSRLREPSIDSTRAANNGAWWAVGKACLLARSSAELEQVRNWASALAPRARLTRGLRPLVILGGMGRRVMQRGKGPLFGDRASAVAVLKLGILG